MSAETFGQLLRRLRRATMATVRYYRGGEYVPMTGPMSQNELARQAGVDAALVHRIEAGRRDGQVRRGTVLALAEALGLDDADTCRLLIAAGYWPWPDLNATTIDAIILAAGVKAETCEEPPFIHRCTG